LDVHGKHIERLAEETNVPDHTAGSAIFRNELLSFVRRAFRMISGGGRTKSQGEAHAHRHGSAGELKPDLHPTPLISLVNTPQAAASWEVLRSTAQSAPPACLSKVELETAVKAICEGLGLLSAGSFEPLSPSMFNPQFNQLVQRFNQLGYHIQSSVSEIDRTSDGVTRRLRIIDRASKEIADRSNRLAQA
jgi:hypothetical protein